METISSLWFCSIRYSFVLSGNLGSINDFNKKPERCGFYWRKGTCCLIGYNVSSVEKYSDGATCFERFELKISQISLTAANLSVSHSFVLSCGLSKRMWSLRNLKRFFDIIVPKKKKKIFI